MSTFLADVRYGCRVLARSPGFSCVAIAALAIGIGANLTIFGFAKELLLSPPAGIDVSADGAGLHAGRHRDGQDSRQRSGCAAAVRAAVADIDPNMALFSVMTLDSATSISLLPVKVAATVAGTLGVAGADPRRHRFVRGHVLSRPAANA